MNMHTQGQSFILTRIIVHNEYAHTGTEFLLIRIIVHNEYAHTGTEFHPDKDNSAQSICTHRYRVSSI